MIEPSDELVEIAAAAVHDFMAVQSAFDSRAMLRVAFRAVFDAKLIVPAEEHERAVAEEHEKFVSAEEDWQYVGDNLTALKTAINQAGFVVLRGDFRLSDGTHSPYYIDGPGVQR